MNVAYAFYVPYTRTTVDSWPSTNQNQFWVAGCLVITTCRLRVLLPPSQSKMYPKILWNYFYSSMFELCTDQSSKRWYKTVIPFNCNRIDMQKQKLFQTCYYSYKYLKLKEKIENYVWKKARQTQKPPRQ